MVAAIATEQSYMLILVAEAIQIHGHDVYYLDRTLVAEDQFLVKILFLNLTRNSYRNVYGRSGGGFAGEQELDVQFGLQNLSEATFVVSKTRFQERQNNTN